MQEKYRCDKSQNSEPECDPDFRLRVYHFDLDRVKSFFFLKIVISPCVFVHIFVLIRWEI